MDKVRQRGITAIHTKQETPFGKLTGSMTPAKAPWQRRTASSKN